MTIIPILFILISLQEHDIMLPTIYCYEGEQILFDIRLFIEGRVYEFSQPNTLNAKILYGIHKISQHLFARVNDVTMLNDNYIIALESNSIIVLNKSDSITLYRSYNLSSTCFDYNKMTCNRLYTQIVDISTNFIVYCENVNSIAILYINTFNNFRYMITSKCNVYQNAKLNIHLLISDTQDYFVCYNKTYLSIGAKSIGLPPIYYGAYVSSAIFNASLYIIVDVKLSSNYIFVSEEITNSIYWMIIDKYQNIAIIERISPIKPQQTVGTLLFLRNNMAKDSIYTKFWMIGKSDYMQVISEYLINNYTYSPNSIFTSDPTRKEGNCMCIGLLTATQNFIFVINKCNGDIESYFLRTFDRYNGANSLANDYALYEFTNVTSIATYDYIQDYVLICNTHICAIYASQKSAIKVVGDLQNHKAYSVDANFSSIAVYSNEQTIYSLKLVFIPLSEYLNSNLIFRTKDVYSILRAAETGLLLPLRALFNGFVYNVIDENGDGVSLNQQLGELQPYRTIFPDSFILCISYESFNSWNDGDVNYIACFNNFEGVDLTCYKSSSEGSSPCYGFVSKIVGDEAHSYGVNLPYHIYSKGYDEYLMQYSSEINKYYIIACLNSVPKEGSYYQIDMVFQNISFFAIYCSKTVISGDTVFLIGAVLDKSGVILGSYLTIGLLESQRYNTVLIYESTYTISYIEPAETVVYALTSNHQIILFDLLNDGWLSKGKLVNIPYEVDDMLIEENYMLVCHSNRTVLSKYLLSNNTNVQKLFNIPIKISCIITDMDRRRSNNEYGLFGNYMAVLLKCPGYSIVSIYSLESSLINIKTSEMILSEDVIFKKIIFNSLEIILISSDGYKIIEFDPNLLITIGTQTKQGLIKISANNDSTDVILNITDYNSGNLVLASLDAEYIQFSNPPNDSTINMVYLDDYFIGSNLSFKAIEGTAIIDFHYGYDGSFSMCENIYPDLVDTLLIGDYLLISTSNELISFYNSSSCFQYKSLLTHYQSSPSFIKSYYTFNQGNESYVLFIVSQETYTSVISSCSLINGTLSFIDSALLKDSITEVHMEEETHQLVGSTKSSIFTLNWDTFLLEEYYMNLFVSWDSKWIAATSRINNSMYIIVRTFIFYMAQINQNLFEKVSSYTPLFVDDFLKTMHLQNLCIDRRGNNIYALLSNAIAMFAVNVSDQSIKHAFTWPISDSLDFIVPEYVMGYQHLVFLMKRIDGSFKIGVLKFYGDLRSRLYFLSDSVYQCTSIYGLSVESNGWFIYISGVCDSETTSVFTISINLDSYININSKVFNNKMQIAIEAYNSYTKSSNITINISFLIEAINFRVLKTCFFVMLMLLSLTLLVYMRRKMNV